MERPLHPATPLHNTSAPRNFKLDTSHQTLLCLYPEHTTAFNIEVTYYTTNPDIEISPSRARTIYIVGP